MAIPVIDRLLAKVRYEHGCWIVTGARSEFGYGVIGIGASRVGKAHRVAYEEIVGPIPPGLHLDHLCRTPACCNPMHLEPVTNEENHRRGRDGNSHKRVQTHCKRGHELSAGNLGTWHLARGHRWCKQCHNLRERERRAGARK